MASSGNAIILSEKSFRSLSTLAQREILSALTGNTLEQSSLSGDFLSEIDENFAQLSPSQVRDLYQGCHERTRKALEIIAKGKKREFHVADIANAIGIKPDELGGVWGGLTKRVRTVTGNKNCTLISWEGHEPQTDSKGTYLDQIGEVTELTYHSLRKLLLK